MGIQLRGRGRGGGGFRPVCIGRREIKFKFGCILLFRFNFLGHTLEI